MSCALKQRNLHLRASQLSRPRKIAEKGCPGVEELIFAGFYSFTAPELNVIRALAPSEAYDRACGMAGRSADNRLASQIATKH